ncbi:MAG: heme exporter protein CcmB [Anaerolineae bacterium]|nr:heme exporter protein CcmB [Anaerolineae bacterium]
MVESANSLDSTTPILPTLPHRLGGYLRKVLAIVGKDITTELRTKEMVGAMFVFSLLILFIFNFAFDLRADNVQTLAPGVLWIAITFAGMLGLSRSFILERDRGVLDGLLLAPVDRSAIYFGKMIGNVLFISFVEIIILPFFIILFNQPLAIIPQLGGVIILGTIGFAGVGTLFSAMAVHTRAREVLLPIMLFPVIIPVMLAAVRLTAGILDNLPFADIQHWLALLVVFDLVFIAASFVLFEFVVEE